MNYKNLYSRILAAFFCIGLLYAGFYKNTVFDQTFIENFRSRSALISWVMNFRFSVLKDNFYHQTYTRDQRWFNYIDEISIDYAQNSVPFTEEELVKIHTKLTSLRQTLADRGIKFYLVVPPNKNTIYPDDINKIAPKLSSISRLDQLIEYERTHDGIDVIDIRSELIEAKETDPVYYSTDTHWNDYGSWLGYTKLLSYISKDFPEVKANPLQNFDIGEKPYTGDLADMSGNLKVSEVVKTLTLREPIEVSYDKTAFYNDYTSSTGNPNLPVALVFKDSFYYLLREKMSQHFDKMVCIGSYTFDYAKVDEVDPDLVIYEITERYIHLLVYLP